MNVLGTPSVPIYRVEDMGSMFL